MRRGWNTKAISLIKKVTDVLQEKFKTILLAIFRVVSDIQVPFPLLVPYNGGHQKVNKQQQIWKTTWKRQHVWFCTAARLWNFKIPLSHQELQKLIICLDHGEVSSTFFFQHLPTNKVLHFDLIFHSLSREVGLCLLCLIEPSIKKWVNYIKTWFLCCITTWDFLESSSKIKSKSKIFLIKNKKRSENVAHEKLSLKFVEICFAA